MPKITDEALEALQIRLFKKDLDALRRLFGKSIGVNQAVRTIVRTFVNQAEAKANVMIDEIETQAAQHLSSLLGEGHEEEGQE